MREYVAIVGSRGYERAERRVREYVAKHVDPAAVIVSGDARGVDQAAEKVAQVYGRARLILPAQWELYGKAAGPIRNEEIAKAAHRVVAFWDGKSRGTKHTIDKAREHGLPVIVFGPDGEQLFLWEESPWAAE